MHPGHHSGAPEEAGCRIGTANMASVLPIPTWNNHSVTPPEGSPASVATRGLIRGLRPPPCHRTDHPGTQVPGATATPRSRPRVAAQAPRSSSNQRGRVPTAWKVALSRGRRAARFWVAVRLKGSPDTGRLTANATSGDAPPCDKPDFGRVGGGGGPVIRCL